MFCKLQIFMQKAMKFYHCQSIEEVEESFTPWQIELQVAHRLNDLKENKIRFKLDEWLSNPVISPISKKLFFLTACINHLFKNVRRSIRSGKWQLQHKVYSDIAKKNPSLMTHMEVEGTADPQSMNIMLEMFNDKAISLLEAEWHEATS
ncbi:hypothetical protein GUITHDRAFT_119681 [Guillardia theta CCMP2712]|uniref:Uncharacterized protein n=1 Tax=Guillardia theta (strain CCMP2712) TaxID=905079 RepID=L1IDE3_GUITC|nr:hypothetical protein GUITHDRAFT_119681 [Guillardia theta CCMP2712]EKX34127.1 hypothetical protein GUITHDRAFT_119681 [Guillardia theta CCMP2712]|eukprot:XP_005821107.1 hypothetical protein GUITHDRAFT_119681 [Guillardia theta CCMP2712]